MTNRCNVRKLLGKCSNLDIYCVWCARTCISDECACMTGHVFVGDTAICWPALNLDIQCVSTPDCNNHCLHCYLFKALVTAAADSGYFTDVFVCYVRHYSSRFTTVRHCSKTFRHCSSLFLTVHHCSSLFVTVCHCSSLFVTVRHCPSQLVATRYCS